MRKSLLNVFILGVITLEGISYGAECRIPFKFDSAKVNTKAVTDCADVLRLQAASQETLQVIGAATQEGSTQYNQMLSEKRAENLKAELQKRYPSLKVEARGIGEIAQDGLIARIVVEESEPAAVAQETVKREELTASVGVSDVSSTSEAQQPSPSNWRFGPRLGQDHTRIENKDDYFAPGLDVAWVYTNYPLRVEVGAIGNIYMEGNEQVMSSIHFAPMIGYQGSGGWIAGVRGLAGIVDSDISGDQNDDYGWEGRFGRETEHWSAFLGAGQTDALDRIGVDIGYRF